MLYELEFRSTHAARLARTTAVVSDVYVWEEHIIISLSEGIGFVHSAYTAFGACSLSLYLYLTLGLTGLSSRQQDNHREWVQFSTLELRDTYIAILSGGGRLRVCHRRDLFEEPMGRWLLMVYRGTIYLPVRVWACIRYVILNEMHMRDQIEHYEICTISIIGKNNSNDGIAVPFDAILSHIYWQRNTYIWLFLFFRIEWTFIKGVRCCN